MKICCALALMILLALSSNLLLAQEEVLEVNGRRLTVDRSKRIQLASTWQTLDDLKACFSQLKVNQDVSREFKAAYDQIFLGLVVGYKNVVWVNAGEGHVVEKEEVHPPPRSYQENLENIVAVCKSIAADSHATDDARNVAALSLVKDIALKAEDCRQFHMGRLINVKFETRKDDKNISGYEILYKWSPDGSHSGPELRAPTLSSPAQAQLVPGIFTIRARKSVGDKVYITEAVRIPIAGQETVLCQISVPQ
jgi:hypothetical protein